MDTARFTRVRLVQRVDFTDDLAVFRFRPEERLNFVPGQYATLAMEDSSGKPMMRPYSVASAPHEEALEFFVELVPEGLLTPRLWPLKEGAELWVRKKIVGRFVLDRESGKPRHVMAATVTGVAPYLSMVRDQQQALAEGRLQEPLQFLIVHGASRSWELGVYLEELTETSRDGWLTYVPTVSRPWEDTEWKGERGRVEDVLRKHMDAHDFHAGNAVGYACGHPQMIENAKGIFQRAGFPKERIREEKYF